MQENNTNLISSDIAKQYRILAELGSPKQKQFTTLKLVNMAQHSIVGLSECFTHPVHRYGAVCMSQQMIYLKYSWTKRLKREWKNVFKTENFQKMRDAQNERLQAALEERIKIHTETKKQGEVRSKDFKID